MNPLHILAAGGILFITGLLLLPTNLPPKELIGEILSVVGTFFVGCGLGMLADKEVK